MWFLPPTSFLSSGGSFLKDLSAGRFITCHDLGIICWTVLLFFLIPVAKKSRSFGFQGHILYCSHFHAVNTTRRHTDVIPFANWKTLLSWSSWRNIRLLTVFWGYLSPDTLSMGGDSWVSLVQWHRYLQRMFLRGHHRNMDRVLILIQRPFWNVNSCLMDADRDPTAR